MSGNSEQKQSWAEAVIECVSDSAERERLIRMYDYDELVTACLALGTLALTAKHESARNKQLEEELAAARSEKPANDELPLQCEAVDGVLDMRVGQKILAFATENCPHLWDAERDRGRYRITDPKVFAEAVARELNHEDEAGSTPLSRLLDEAIEDAIGQGAEGVEEVE